MSQSRSFNNQSHPSPHTSRSNIANQNRFGYSGHNQSIRRSQTNAYETHGSVSDHSNFVYGTNISTNEVGRLLQRFVTTFEMAIEVNGVVNVEKYYFNKLHEIELYEKCEFDVQGYHLKEHDRHLYYQFIYFPVQMLEIFDRVIQGLYEKFFIEAPEQQISKEEIYEKRIRMRNLKVSLYHIDEVVQVKNFGPKYINRLITFQGIIIRTSDIYPDMKIAYFICNHCGHHKEVQLFNAVVKEPAQCEGCRHRHSFELSHNLSKFHDKQFIKLQELPESVSEGETPHSVTAISYHSDVDGMRPGDRVQIVGIYRAQPVKVQRIKSEVKSVFNTYIDLISFRILEENRYRSEESAGKQKFSDDEKQEFMRMANRGNIINDLVDSFAPSIYGNEEVKKGILTQLFGGTVKQFKEMGRGRFRSDINICLVGDPSTAKSQLLQQVYKIAPRGIYTSGRGSSAVGLTANVRKDPETKEFILQSGALVLSDLGICCIDQFDKMDDNSRTILLEAMEQQTISIAKAGIVCQLNSRTAILAAANPVHSKYDAKKSVVENINLPPALLSRFDLIYIMLDVPNMVNDRKLASHILDIYSNKEAHKINNGVYKRTQLAKYISYARDYVQPVLTEEAGKKLSRAYMEMRQLGTSKKTITATPRQLESLIRMSEAFAKMRLSNIVELSDVQQAINLVKVAMQQAATDPTTGLIDMGIINTGRTTAIKNKILQIANQAKDILKANISKYNRTTTIQSFLFDFLRHHKQGQKVTSGQMQEALTVLQTEDILVIIRRDKYNKSFKLQKQLAF